MKDSGLSWIGQVPVEWPIIRTRAALAIAREEVGAAWAETPLLSLTKQGVVIRDIDSGEGKFPASFEGYQVVQPDDLVFCLFDMDETPCTVGRVKTHGMITGAYTRFIVRRDVAEPRFLEWYYLAIDQGKRFRPLYTGLRKVVQKPRFLGAGLVLPPLAEQRAIADYLDRETASIDSLIEEQQRLIEMLHERKDSEAEALFRTPADARMTTVKRVLRPLSRPAVTGLGVITAFRDGVVTLRSNRREDGYTFSNTENGYQEICPGDLVFHALDGFAGAVGVSDSHGNATPVYHVCEATAGDHLPYVARMLRFLGRSGFLATQAPNVRERSVDFRNWSTFGRLPLSLPPVEEQRRVVEHVAAQEMRTDTLIAETERFIELSRERRAALITAAVTGQIDVRETV